MHLSSFQLLHLAEKFNIPSLLKQLNENALIDSKQATTLMPPTNNFIQSGVSSPPVSTSPPANAFNPMINTSFITPQLNPALCAGKLKI